MSSILIPIVVLGSLGLVFAIILGVASKAFHVAGNPLAIQVRAALPGANCGACGYPGCDGLSNAIAEGKAPVNSCPVGGKVTAERIAAIMGTEAGDSEQMVACVLCQGDCHQAKEKYQYRGLRDCRAANIFHAGNKSCSFGCLGCGTCVDVCEFDALHVIDGVAVVDKEKCVACKKCIEICPKQLIELVPYKKSFIVKCKNTEKGKEVKDACAIGCIGCQLCVKNCPKEAIGFENNLAKIDYEKCVNCGICATKCPTKAIYNGKTAGQTLPTAANE